MPVRNIRISFMIVCLSASLSAQDTLRIRFKPVVEGRVLSLNQGMRLESGDSFCLQTLRFYVGEPTFFHKGKKVYSEDKQYHLLDMERQNPMEIAVVAPEKIRFDALQFTLGVDSLTTVSGAFGGDLDPTNGMYWSWQSGYIHVKIEGYYEKCPARNHQFQLHLGGYLAPFQSARQVRVPVGSKRKSAVELRLDLSDLFSQVDWQKKYNIMSPSREAVLLSEFLSQQFKAGAH